MNKVLLGLVMGLGMIGCVTEVADPNELNASGEAACLVHYGLCMLQCQDFIDDSADYRLCADECAIDFRICVSAGAPELDTSDE